MIFTKDEVYQICKQVAPAFGFEAKLAFAFCLQESAKDSKGNFNPSRARLEPGFYSYYIEKQELETTNEVLYSASFGILQMMGQSLKEVGYFQWYFDQQSDNMKSFLGNPFSEISVPKAINYYCTNLEVMITWGLRWLKKKNELAKGNIQLLCRYWNGDKTGKYYNELMQKYNSIKEQ